MNATWLPIGEEQRDGRRWTVNTTESHGREFSVYWKNEAWRITDTDRISPVNPTHYLAHIPPVPEPAKAPTADEWERAYAEYKRQLDETGVGDPVELKALLARAKEAR